METDVELTSGSQNGRTVELSLLFLPGTARDGRFGSQLSRCRGGYKAAIRQIRNGAERSLAEVTGGRKAVWPTVNRRDRSNADTGSQQRLLESQVDL